MRRPRTFGVGIVGAVLAGACGFAAALAACSSSSTPSGGTTPGNDSGAAQGDDSSTPGACTQSSALQIHFAPMYSAFITDSTSQQFQVPAVVTGTGTGTAKWSASDANAVSFSADPTTGGTIMTVKSATPTVTITAQVGTLCTSTTLNITSALQADWAAGNARYNNGVPLYPGCIDQKVAPVLADAGITVPPPPDAGCPDAGPACTACHGANPTGGFFTGVQHTPEQTAGFSDSELVDIFVRGTVADGGAYDTDLVPYNYWQLFHTWSDIATPEEQKGMVVYLRSLAPAVEQGGLNFGGLADAGVITTN